MFYAPTPQKRIDVIIGMRIKAGSPGSANTHKELPAYAWLGGYDITYYDENGESLCPSCASKAIDEFIQARIDAAMEGFLWDDYSEMPQYSDIYWEGPSIFCAECNKEIPSQYGDPFAD